MYIHTTQCFGVFAGPPKKVFRNPKSENTTSTFKRVARPFPLYRTGEKYKNVYFFRQRKINQLFKTFIVCGGVVRFTIMLL